MPDHTCPCCGGTGRLDPAERPLCSTALQQRDERSPAQLRRMAALQRVAFRHTIFDEDGGLKPPHGQEYVDYTDGRVVA